MHAKSRGFKALAIAALMIVCGCAYTPAESTATSTEPKPVTRPSFLLIVADDLGYSDIGAFGGEIETPNLDRLALSGVRLTSFHASPLCSPTRAMLMTGLDNHRVGLGTLDNLISPLQQGQPGYEGYLTDTVPTLAETLAAAGYATMMTGKWHLGSDEDQIPAARGFERSYVVLEGAHDHFGLDQGGAWEAAGWGTNYRDGARAIEYPRGAYSADVFTDEMIGFLSEADPQAPLFAYLAYTQPHWPLQAPDEAIEKYRGRYDDGPTRLRERRIQSMKQLGLIPEAMAPADMVGQDDWNRLSEDERRIEARKMEVYAGMVDRMDWNIGRVIDALEASGRLDSTIIIFLSDNGPDAGSRTAPPRLSAEVTRTLEIDNSLENMGRPGSYVGYGPAWAQASSPFYLFKSYPTEGGIRTAAFITGPGLPPGRIEPAFTHVMDVPATILDLSGEPVEARLTGKSWVDLITGRAAYVHAPDSSIGWEVFYRRAIRIGNWKAVYLPAETSVPFPGSIKTEGWQLFNLDTDPGETTNLADRHPEKLAELRTAWASYQSENGVVLAD